MQKNLSTVRLPWRRCLPGVALLGLLNLLGTLPLQAQDTKGINSPGLILLKTTSASFHVTVVGGFFGAGSDSQTVLPLSLKGQELATSPPGVFGTGSSTVPPPVDTVLELEYPYAAPGISEFRVVGLHLGTKYTQPVTVTYNGGARSETWDVEVCLSAVKQLGGLIELALYPATGSCYGTFKYSLAVTPKLIFTRRGGGSEPRYMDTGTTAFISFLANGRWANRSQFQPNSLGGASLFEVANQFQEAFIDANCDGNFDRESSGDCLTERLPTLASSDLVLGADCNYTPGSVLPRAWSIQPYIQGPEQTQTVQAATQ